MDHYRQHGLPPPLPPADLGPIFEWLQELGFVDADGMGRRPLGWRTIRAWRLETGAIANAWDVRLLRRLSTEYLAESVAAEDPTRAAPYQHVVTVHERAAAEWRKREMLGAF